MTTASDAIDGLLDTYLLALGGVDQCPESVPPEVKGRLLANVERAERAFADAAADGLGGDCTPLAPVVSQLIAVNRTNRRNLRDAQPIVRLVNELEKATSLAVEIVARLAIPFQPSPGLPG